MNAGLLVGTLVFAYGVSSGYFAKHQVFTPTSGTSALARPPTGTTQNERPRTSSTPAYATSSSRDRLFRCSRLVPSFVINMSCLLLPSRHTPMESLQLSPKSPHTPWNPSNCPPHPDVAFFVSQMVQDTSRMAQDTFKRPLTPSEWYVLWFDSFWISLDLISSLSTPHSHSQPSTTPRPHPYYLAAPP